MSLTTNLPLSTNITLLEILGYKKLAASLKSFRWYNAFGLTKLLKPFELGFFGFGLSFYAYTKTLSAAGITHLLSILGLGFGMAFGWITTLLLAYSFGKACEWLWSKR